MTAFTYPVRLEEDDNDTIMVTFPDFREGVTFGEDRDEPPRDCRRLQLLRGWSYDKENIGKIFT